jgi:hypothetical protein
MVMVKKGNASKASPKPNVAKMALAKNTINITNQGISTRQRYYFIRNMFLNNADISSILPMPFN